MNEQEQQIADELDALISARQIGQPTDTTRVSANEAAFAAQLVALSQRVVPVLARAKDFNAPVSLALPNQPKQQPSNGHWQDAESASHSVDVKPSRTRFALASAVAFAVLVLASALVFAMLQMKPRPQVAQAPIANTVPALTPISPQVATVAPSLQAIPPGFTATLEGYRLTGRELVLSATLPSNVDAPAVKFRLPKRIEPDELRAMAVRLGMQPNLYRSGWNKPYATSTQLIVPTEAPPLGGQTWFEAIAVIDGQRRLSTYNGFDVAYTTNDLDFCCAHDGSLSSVNNEVLQRILSETQILSGTYSIEPNSDTLFSEGIAYRKVEGHAVGGTEAVFSVNDAQQLGFANISLLDLEIKTTDRVKLRGAQETLGAVQSGNFAGLLKFAASPTTMSSTPISPTMPQWLPHYLANRPRELFAHPALWWPVDAGLEPILSVGGFRLRSERMATLWDDAMRGKLNVWGAVTTTTAGIPVMQVAGWEVVTSDAYPSFEFAPVSGKIKLDLASGTTLFVQADGKTFALPQAPENVSDGMWVQLYGGMARGREVNGYPVMLFETIFALSEAEASKPQVAQVPYIEVTGKYAVMRIEGQDVRVFKAEDGKIYIADGALSNTGLNDTSSPFSKTMTLGGGLRPETFAGYPLLDVRMTADGAGFGGLKPSQMTAIRMTTPQAGKLIVERVALVYYTPNRPGNFWAMSPTNTDAENLDLIPMWRFSGHTEFGDVFAILADARE